MNAVELVVLAAIWGASFLFMRMGSSEFGPVPLIALRVGIAALVLLPVIFSATSRLHVRSHWKPLLVVGLTNSALPFCLFAYSTLYVNAGLDSILNATTPLWGALIAFVWLKVSLTRDQILGMVLGLAGVLVLVWDQLGAGQGTQTLAILAVLLATLSYGFAGHYSRRHLVGLPAPLTAWASQFFSVLVLLPGALYWWPQHAVSDSAWWAVIGLGVVCTGLAYVLYFRLIAHTGASYAMSVTFLIPVFGVAWGALFLHEQVGVQTTAGCLVILLGTALATGKLQLLQRLRAA
ncbi:drug/metabolite transporter (DMT)-like permease [Silvimonas terrae]|uniref:Drug/metabolite transporter (DMT)-like permease n=1 Tax=Silvimonas terrae TaxID=300266 RepID=A0A840R975_9NEIS|nr:DMT family transporter [Silvimonas terrae]MBB5189919.1 drug/metabolite transporter (DMT)-like permease [Silvimonas terrae]